MGLLLDNMIVNYLQAMIEDAQEEERELAAEMAANFLNEDLPEAVFGAAKASAGMWASQVRVIHPITGLTLDTIQLEQNEAAHWYVSHAYSQGIKSITAKLKTRELLFTYSVVMCL